MIRAIIFDCFGVFYPDPVFAYMRDPHSPPETARALHELDWQAARGNLTKVGFVEQAAALLHLSPTIIEQRFFQGRDRNQALLGYVQNLRPQYKIALLSNIGGDMMEGFFTSAEREQLFDTTVLSGDVGIAKPDQEIFALTCRRLGVTLLEAVMIDDVESNCEATRSFGMQAIGYKDFEQLKAELEQSLG
jgi:FMN phosphatase YigB (HAD superfamily)